MADAADEFWQFSLAFYERPGVAEALIALQDRRGLDVNLILFALWHGVSGRGRLDRAALVAADRAVAAIREVAAALRALRRHLKPELAADIERLRNQIEEAELEAEKLAQRRLALAASLPGVAHERLGDAVFNLGLYVGREPEASMIGQSLDAFLGD
jgi:uncharacterized protein (TIGR02444 family)